VVLDATAQPIDLSTEQVKHLGDRRFGVGADQVLVVERGNTPDVDFRYRIYNGASGHEVEHCGNGARCFMRFVRDRKLTDQATVRVATVNRVLTLHMQTDGRVSVDMSRPVFDVAALPFDATGLQMLATGNWHLWTLPELPEHPFATLSVGNPHAVLRVADVDTAPVATLGPHIEHHPRFARGVNVGFMQVSSRNAIRLRVHERDAGETLACGTGACAAVVAGIRLGWLARRVEVATRGGPLLIEWPQDDAAVLMTGPAETVFEGEITL